MYIYKGTKRKILRWTHRGFVFVIAAAALVSFAAVVYMIFINIQAGGLQGVFDGAVSCFDLIGVNSGKACSTAEELIVRLGENIASHAETASAAIAEFVARIAAKF